MSVYKCVCVGVCTYVCACACACACACVCALAYSTWYFENAALFVCMHVCACVSVCVCWCKCVCLRVCMHTEQCNTLQHILNNGLCDTCRLAKDLKEARERETILQRELLEGVSCVKLKKRHAEGKLDGQTGRHYGRRTGR